MFDLWVLLIAISSLDHIDPVFRTPKLNMTKPRKGKPDSPNHGTLPPSGLAMESLYDLMIEHFTELEDKVATKDCINGLLEVVNEQKQKISLMEDKIAVMESHISQLHVANDGIEQYQRRLCLRISGIELPSLGQNETAQDCLDKIKDAFADLGVEIPCDVVDRAHRIGKATNYNGKKCRQMIVRFATWRHRTMVYRARKNSGKYRIRLDLTKRRSEILEKANKLLESSETSFVFADINCNLCWFNCGTYQYFNNLEDLKLKK